MQTLPNDFEKLMMAQLGDELCRKLTDGLQGEPTVSIRLNPQKTCRYGLDTVADESQRVPWCDDGRYLKSRPDFTFDPLMHAGAYYVQEASSMFLHHVLRHLAHEPVVMLDLCAAPGGKSGVALGALPAGSLLFTNEALRPRASILCENMSKTGAVNTVVTNSWAKDYGKTMPGCFDLILADVPCSGEGMFRKDSGAVADWSLQKVGQCRDLQRQIVADVWPALRPGGILVYSTCTFNTHEDEENALWIARELGAEFVSIPVDEAWNIVPSLVDGAQTYRFLPGITRGEGLFMTVLLKNGSSEKPAPHKQKGNKPRHGKPAKQPDLPLRQLLDGDFETVLPGERVLAIPEWWLPLYQQAARGLNILQAGVPLATPKGRSFQPDAALAFSTALRDDAYPRVELSYDDAIRYLRREPVTLPEATPRGYVLCCFEGLPLGYENNIGTRANNLYPQEWRIRSTHLPEQRPEVLKPTRPCSR